ncbi:hypothetical protein LWI29_006591 [Acer saccharum]|uniref:Uncharacterized protein n=1 Tax=Acer saccharum TaxID=4024 RepID=A0AA39VFU6_ACESA|nr:hypothetical protein LWI29_006591 [Acer saccharum]
MAIKPTKKEKKEIYDAKLCQLLDDYSEILVVAADNVESNQLQNISRKGRRGRAWWHRQRRPQGSPLCWRCQCRHGCRKPGSVAIDVNSGGFGGGGGGGEGGGGGRGGGGGGGGC